MIPLSLLNLGYLEIFSQAQFPGQDKKYDVVDKLYFVNYCREPKKWISKMMSHPNPWC